MARSGAEQPALRVLHHVTAPYRGRGQFVGIVVAVGRGTVDVHFRDGDFAAGVDAAAVSLYTGRRPRASAGLPRRAHACGSPKCTRNGAGVVASTTPTPSSAAGGNRAYQRDTRAFDDEALNANAPATPMDDDDDDGVKRARAATASARRSWWDVGHVATVELAPRDGDEECWCAGRARATAGGRSIRSGKPARAARRAGRLGRRSRRRALARPATARLPPASALADA